MKSALKYALVIGAFYLPPATSLATTEALPSTVLTIEPPPVHSEETSEEKVIEPGTSVPSAKSKNSIAYNIRLDGVEDASEILSRIRELIGSNKSDLLTKRVVIKKSMKRSISNDQTTESNIFSLCLNFKPESGDQIALLDSDLHDLSSEFSNTDFEFGEQSSCEDKPKNQKAVLAGH